MRHNFISQFSLNIKIFPIFINNIPLPHFSLYAYYYILFDDYVLGGGGIALSARRHLLPY